MNPSDSGIPGKVWKITGILASYVALSASIALLLIHASRGRELISVGAGLASWLSYSLLHYIDEGRFTDPPKRLGGKTRPKHWLPVILAVLLFCGGIAVIALGVNRNSFFLTFAGSLTSMLGYLIGHRGITSSLV